MGTRTLKHVCLAVISLFLMHLLSIPCLLANEGGTAFSDNNEPSPLVALEAMQTDLAIGGHRFLIGPVVSDFNYEEPSLMKDTGTLYGLMARYCFRDQEGGMFQTELQMEMGDLDYDGGLWDGRPLQANTKDYIIEWRAIGGIDFLVGQGHLVTPWIGIGYRYLNDNMEDTPLNDGSGDIAKGYEREVAYWYLPVGFQALTPLSPKVSIGVHLEYDFFLEGKVTSHLDNTDPSLDVMHNDQASGKGYGIKGAVQVRLLLDNQRGLIFEPFLSYWDISDSEGVLLGYDPTTGEYVVVYEPENNTMHYGLRAMVEF